MSELPKLRIVIPKNDETGNPDVLMTEIFLDGVEMRGVARIEIDANTPVSKVTMHIVESVSEIDVSGLVELEVVTVEKWKKHE